MEAYLYEKLDDRKVQCNLCNHRCIIKDQRRGICKVRENREGRLVSLVYGRLIAGNADPIEKKPLYHFLPASRSYSIATVGCNFKCRFCQNADIAQMPADRSGMIMGDQVTPQAVVDAAIQSGCKSISYTYTEPTIFFEFAYDTALLACDRGLKNVFVSNGYMTIEALEMIGPYLDAANVDLKSFSDDYYQTQCGAKLEPVKASLKQMRRQGIFVEVTTLLIPGLNDDRPQLEALARFLADELGPDTPWHVSRFIPQYKYLDSNATPIETIQKAEHIGKQAGLKYVYPGNIPGTRSESTFCPNCQKLLIERQGYQIINNEIENSACPKCDTPIAGFEL